MDQKLNTHFGYYMHVCLNERLHSLMVQKVVGREFQPLQSIHYTCKLNVQYLQTKVFAKQSPGKDV